MAAEPADGLAQLGDGVVVVGHRAVSGGALDRQTHPVHALLRRLDQIKTQILVDGEGEAADLADRLRNALEEIGVVVDEIPRAVRTARLLVGEEGQHDVARGLTAAAQPVPYDREGHRVHVLHVDRATAPDTAVRDLARERVVRPVVGVGGDDIGVAVDEQGGPGGILALDPGDGRGTAPVGLEDPRFETHLGELLGDIFGGGPLSRSGVVAVVAGVDPDQIAAEVDDLVLAGGGPARVRLAHAAHSHGRCWWSPHPPAYRPRTPRRFPARHTPVTRYEGGQGRDRAPPIVCYGFPRRNGPEPSGRHLVRVAEWQTR